MLINNMQQPSQGVNQTFLAENANNDSSNATHNQDQLKKDAKKLFKLLPLIFISHGPLSEKTLKDIQDLICLLIKDIKNMNNSSDKSDQTYIQDHPEFGKLEQEMSAVPCKGFVALNQAAQELNTNDMRTDCNAWMKGASDNYNDFMVILQDIYTS